MHIKRTLQNGYVTNGNIWTIDETLFNENRRLFLPINLKTRTMSGYIIYKNFLNEDILIDWYDKLFFQNQRNNPTIIHSDNEPIFSLKLIVYFLSSRNIKQSFTLDNKNQNQVSESVNERIKR